jgi:hypothetical protein
MSFTWIRREPMYPLAEVMMFYRALTTAEEQKFREWARDNYEPGSEIKGSWHPVVQAECVAINRQRAMFVADVAVDT